jgi:hypothetical protein
MSESDDRIDRAGEPGTEIRGPGSTIGGLTAQTGPSQSPLRALS